MGEIMALVPGRVNGLTGSADALRYLVETKARTVVARKLRGL